MTHTAPNYRSLTDILLAITDLTTDVSVLLAAEPQRLTPGVTNPHRADMRGMVEEVTVCLQFDTQRHVMIHPRRTAHPEFESNGSPNPRPPYACPSCFAACLLFCAALPCLSALPPFCCCFFEPLEVVAVAAEESVAVAAAESVAVAAEESVAVAAAESVAVAAAESVALAAAESVAVEVELPVPASWPEASELLPLAALPVTSVSSFAKSGVPRPVTYPRTSAHMSQSCTRIQS